MKLIDIEFFAGDCGHRKGLYSQRDGLLFYCDLAPGEIFPLDEAIIVCTGFCPKKRGVADDE
jgi:hypothetical protein